MLLRFGTKSQLIFDWQQIPRSEPVTLHYRRTLRWYGQRTLRPSKVELCIEEHFGYAAGDPTPLLTAKLRLPDVFHLVVFQRLSKTLRRSDRTYSVVSAATQADTTPPPQLRPLRHAKAMFCKPADSSRPPARSHKSFWRPRYCACARKPARIPQSVLGPRTSFLTSPKVQVGQNLHLQKRKDFPSYSSTFSLVLGLL